MNRIEKTFEALKNKKEKALVGFVTAGDPNIDDSLKIITGLCKSGLDILELGVPFSDPTADGPVIQRSSARALSKGANLKSVIGMTKKLREQTQIPIILFSYYNPILAYGNEAFYRDSVAAGADGVLIVDLPPEESDELTCSWKNNELSLIRLIAPTTPEERMRKIISTASGFIYLVSKTGVTGSDGLNTQEISSLTNLVRSISHIPVCVGFGISTPADVTAIASVADGVVIGSAFERIIEENLNATDLAEMMAKRAAEYKQATLIK